jgi:hypothetical protein
MELARLITAHVAGLPVEETFVALVPGGVVLLAGLRVAVRRIWRTARQPYRVRQAG